MMDHRLVLLATAASIGLVHTLLGPDHYVPFIAMSRASRWSMRKTLAITLLCGVGHVLSSALLGLAGVLVGVALFKVQRIEELRGQIAGWMLLAFGFVYFLWGIRQAVRSRPHSHVHAHADGTVHDHTHLHAREHVHAHTKELSTQLHPRSTGALADPPPLPTGDTGGLARRVPPNMTPWILFTIFIFGPCEPLIPLLMYPAAAGRWHDVVGVTVIFALATLSAMTAMVWLAARTMAIAGKDAHSSRFKFFHRFGHALAGFSILACGLAVKMGL